MKSITDTLVLHSDLLAVNNVFLSFSGTYNYWKLTVNQIGFIKCRLRMVNICDNKSCASSIYAQIKIT